MGDPTCSRRILDYPTIRMELQRGVFNWLKQKGILVRGSPSKYRGAGVHSELCSRPGAPAGSTRGRRRPCVLRPHPPAARGPRSVRGLCLSSVSLPPCPPVEPRDSDGKYESALK